LISIPGSEGLCSQVSQVVTETDSQSAMLDYSYLVLGTIALFTVLGMAYYATRILLQMRTGELEKSWKYLVAGAYLVEAAIVLLLVAEFFFQNSSMSFILSHLSVTLLVVGAVYIFLGFRAHYQVFNPRYPELKMQDVIEK
jgi:drug/metabolite transporter (DMT)-like permease